MKATNKFFLKWKLEGSACCIYKSHELTSNIRFVPLLFELLRLHYFWFVFSNIKISLLPQTLEIVLTSLWFYPWRMIDTYQWRWGGGVEEDYEANQYHSEEIYPIMTLVAQLLMLLRHKLTFSSPLMVSRTKLAKILLKVSACLLWSSSSSS